MNKSLTKKIRVAFISHSSKMFGSERSLLLLLKNINRNNFEPIVMLQGKGTLRDEIHRLKIKTYSFKFPWWLKEKIDIFRIFYYSILEILAVIRLYFIVKKEKVDVIYTNTLTIFSGSILSFFTKIPNIWHIREVVSKKRSLNFLYLPLTLLFKLVYWLADKIIVNSRYTGSQFPKMDSCEKIRVIYNSLSTREYQNIERKNSLSPNWNICVIGALHKGKAQDDAILAVDKARIDIPNIKLLIVGTGTLKYERYLKMLVNKLKLNENIEFMGYRNDIPNVLSLCNVLISPALNEAFGRVAIEAMASGIPVIGVEEGGISEIIEDSKTGYLVPPKKTDMIAEKLVYLFRHPDIAEEFGKAGKKVVKEKFSLGRYICGIENIILEVYKLRCPSMTYDSKSNE